MEGGGTRLFFAVPLSLFLLFFSLVTQCHTEHTHTFFKIVKRDSTEYSFVLDTVEGGCLLPITIRRCSSVLPQFVSSQPRTLRAIPLTIT